MKKVLAILLALAMVFSFVACGGTEEQGEEEVKFDPNAKDEGVMTYAEYIAAEEGADVVIEGFITSKVYAKDYGNCNLFVQDGDGAYFVYRMACTDEDDAKLTVGAKVKITGVKTAWSGEVEIKEGTATYEVVGTDTYEFDVIDVSSKLVSEDLINYQNMKVKVSGATVKEAPLYKWDGSGEHGDDIYVTFTVGGNDYTFVVESDVCDGDSDTYKAVEALTVGKTVMLEGLMYWYNGPQMWITSVKEYSGKVVVYSPHDADPLAAGIALFEATYPDIVVEKVAAGSGELAQRLAAEAENPQGDVFWGGGADTLAAYTDYFQPYVCVNDSVIDEAYKDANDLWIGESPLPMVFIYNKDLISEEDVPKTWEDLCDESLKGKIAFASPAKSGSAYTQLCTMLFSQDTMDEGWDLVSKFVANLDGKIQDSSGNCHKLVASGEYAVGVTIEKSAVLYDDVDNIGYVYPTENSAVPDGVALIKNCPNEDNAKLFIDFVTGLECQKDQNVNWKRRPVRSDLQPEGLCALSELDLGDYDFNYAALNRDDIKEQFNDITAQ